ncbi:hypothetical protein AgCh_018635 [Apium graveolens]
MKSVDDESEGGFLKLKTTSEWLLGDNTAPVNKKVMYEESSSPVIQETLQFPIQKVSCGIGGIGIGHTVKNEFCSSCSYNDLPRVLTYGGHQRFQVELRPREMTIVSWKKLVKDANRAVEKDKSTAKEMPIFEKPVVEAPVDSRQIHGVQRYPPGHDIACSG